MSAAVSACDEWFATSTAGPLGRGPVTVSPPVLP